MEREVRSHYHTRASGAVGGKKQNSNASASSASERRNAERDLLLQWGRCKRLRCARKEYTAKNNKQAGNSDKASPQPAARIDPEPAAHQRVISASRADLENALDYRTMIEDHRESATAPPPPPPLAAPPQPQAYSRRTRQQSRNSEAAAAAKATAGSPERDGAKGAAVNGGACSEEKKSGGAGSSSGSEGAAVWPPKFTIALTNKEKEEDFLVLKGSRLPQRPKKRAKLIQRTLNLVYPGGWLCDLSLDRYEVREKKVSKKRARGLKALGNMESDSE